MTNQHPITPLLELVEKWANDSVPMRANAIGRDWEIAFATRAAQWGADQELEACCEWVNTWCTSRYLGDAISAEALRAARRPKPLNLKEQAIAVLEDANLDSAHYNILLRALEQLDD